MIKVGTSKSRLESAHPLARCVPTLGGVGGVMVIPKPIPAVSAERKNQFDSAAVSASINHCAMASSRAARLRSGPLRMGS